MVSEKISASTDSLFGIAMASVRMQARLASLWAQAWCAPSADAMAKLMQSSAADFSKSAVSPYLEKVRANRRRLSR